MYLYHDPRQIDFELQQQRERAAADRLARDLSQSEPTLGRVVRAGFGALAAAAVVAVAVLPADHAGAADDPSSCTFAAGYRPACSQLAGAADGWFSPNGAEQPTDETIVTRTRPVR